MRFAPKEIILKDGRACVLRPTAPEDAEAMIQYLKETAGETEYLLRYPDEVTFTVEGEREILGSMLDDPSSVMMVAIADGRVAGNCSVNGIGSKRKIRHRCSMANWIKEKDSAPLFDGYRTVQGILAYGDRHRHD